MIKEELLKETYIEKQILDVIEGNKDSKYSLSIKVRGEHGETNWIDVSNDDLRKFAKFAKAKKFGKQ